MLEALQLRTLVIGNSGSGKSRLAEGLGALIHAPIFDLDLIHWKDNGFGAKQDEDVARQKVANLAATEHWVIEGVVAGWSCGSKSNGPNLAGPSVGGLPRRLARTRSAPRWDRGSFF